MSSTYSHHQHQHQQQQQRSIPFAGHANTGGAVPPGWQTVDPQYSNQSYESSFYTANASQSIPVSYGPSSTVPLSGVALPSYSNSYTPSPGVPSSIPYYSGAAGPGAGGVPPIAPQAVSGGLPPNAFVPSHPNAPDFAGGGQSGGVPGAGSPSAFQDFLHGAAGQGLIRSGLGAYGEKLIGSGREYVANNVNKYFASTDYQYYFQVSDTYVRNKLRLVLLPFFHNGHWTRVVDHHSPHPSSATSSSSPSSLFYLPPCQDVNAPDLFLPLAAFLSCVVLGGMVAGIERRFSPGLINHRFSRSLFGWFLNSLLLRVLLYLLCSSLPHSHHHSSYPHSFHLLDIVAYAGYIFVSVSLTMLTWMLTWRHWAYVTMVVFSGTSLSVFLVKTMRRVVSAETRHHYLDKDSSRHKYMLLVMAALQFPLIMWLGRVS